MFSSSAPNPTHKQPGRVSRRARGRVAEFYPYHSLRAFNTLKREAMSVVKHALQTGALVRQACSECGVSKSEGHHDDYSKPLEVIWLCRFHHRRRDAELRDARRAAVKAAARSALPLAYLVRQARLQPVPFASGRSTQQRRRSLVSKDCALALVVQATVAVSDAMDAEQLHELHLATRLKVSRQYVNALFSGGFRSLKMLAAFADALGYDASFVLRKREPELLRNVEPVGPAVAFQLLSQLGEVPSQRNQSVEVS